VDNGKPQVEKLPAKKKCKYLSTNQRHIIPIISTFHFKIKKENKKIM